METYFYLSSIEPSTKIKTILDYFKDYNLKSVSGSFEVPFTRQQITNLTDMPVETYTHTQFHCRPAQSGRHGNLLVLIHY